MARTAVIYHSEYLNHGVDDHPENKRRLEAVMRFLEEEGVLRAPEVKVLEPERAGIEEVMLNHDVEYIEYVRALSDIGGML
ncbi:MAG: histone deacetylase, partial [Candidatus Freyarchaeota archaeon]|nr:histone deacetylase [Candidatus Jordarchaeia archaeon]